MNSLKFACIFVILGLSAFPTAAQEKSTTTEIEIHRLPDGGIQPQAVTDADGTVHLVWLKGTATADVFYQRILPNGDASEPIRVNKQPHSAIAIGTIRGAQIAVGRNGFVHVVWNGSPRGMRHVHDAHAAHEEGKRQNHGHERAPLYYTRFNPKTGGFDPERDLLGQTAALDGGGTVAADKKGNVFVMWHAAPNAGNHNEGERRVFVALSKDDGETFAPEKPIDEGRGACSCCGMDALSDSNGNVFALFRTASTLTNRNITLLSSKDGANEFRATTVHEWTIGSCPMSGAALASSLNRSLAAWETKGEVYFGAIDPTSLGIQKVVRAPNRKGSKHPSLASNAKGEVLVTWTEGTGWQRGGTVAWTLFDGDGNILQKGQKEGVPVWSYAAGYARRDGSFVIIY